MQKIKLIASLIACSFLLTSCTNSQLATELPLPENFLLPQKQIYSFGEATHGSAEFTLARQSIFEYLVIEHGVRAFCLEADFGEGQMINNLLYDDNWNAKNVMNMFSFWIYRHEEMENLMQWLRDYNDAAAENEQVRFYGFDCQQWDKSKWILQSYLESVSPELLLMLQAEPLSKISDKSIPSQETETFALAIQAMDKLILSLEENKQQYCANLEEREHDIAMQAAKSMRECLRMQLVAPDAERLFEKNLTEEEAERILAQTLAAGNMRDAFMAEHVAWICEHEEKYYGNESIFITGHNGHITKENDFPEDVCLGELLLESYGDEYYAIGSDFVGGWFKAVELGGRGRLKVFKLEDGPMAERFAATDKTMLFLLSDDLSNENYFKNTQSMHRIGAMFSKEMAAMPDTYFSEVIPGEWYDAVLVFRNIHAFH
ncbi:erythromycin esterase family protein [Eubacteriales bacterium OttesenSCG-928-K08]|nr:erythromycin esterase family protein [Eubacteriales bacterium OttesenSCG-928-K08]